MPQRTTAISADPAAPVRRIYTGDNLPILRSMNSESADLIYPDPPFNSGKQWANPIHARGRTAPAEFKDTWDLSDIHIDHEFVMRRDCPEAIDAIDAMAAVNGESWKAYLIYMGARLLEVRRLLKPTGSVYYHCDPVMSHGVKILLDAVFRKNNFQNEFVWYYGGGGASARRWGRKHDILLFYAKGKKWTFNADSVRVRHKWDEGQLRADGSARDYEKGKIADDVFQLHAVMPWAKERTGYPTQKPLALLKRIIRASSNKGDLVLDPFCGCATTCLAAEHLGRSWIGVDLSEKAADLIVKRLRDDVESPLADPEAKVQHLRRLPKRTDLPGIDKRDPRLRAKLYFQQDRKCSGCGEKMELRHLETDHFIAKAIGGQDEESNFQLLCGNCNRVKGRRGMGYLLRQIAERMERDRYNKLLSARLADIRRRGEAADGGD